LIGSLPLLILGGKKKTMDASGRLGFRIKPFHQIGKEIGQSREKGSAIDN
jgi:hypothetical protein